MKIEERDGFYHFDSYREEEKAAYEGTRQRSYIHTEAMFSDGEHPNDLGFTQYAKLLGKALKKCGVADAE